MDLLYDTNILIEAIKISQNDEKKFWKKINPNKKTPFISIVTYAETQVISLCNAWGNNRIQKLNNLVEEIQIIRIIHKTAYYIIISHTMQVRFIIPVTTFCYHKY